MSIIDEETIKEYDKLYRGDNPHLADDLLTIAVMELIKSVNEQNELIKAIGIQINNVEGELTKEIRKQNELLDKIQIQVNDVGSELTQIDSTLYEGGVIIKKL